MITKKQRVPLRQLPDFFKTATKVQNQNFRVYVGKNLNQTRVAVVVPKKQLKKATKRNKLRRRVLGVLSSNFDKLPKKDLVVIPNAKLAELTSLEISNSLENLLTKIK